MNIRGGFLVIILILGVVLKGLVAEDNTARRASGHFKRGNEEMRESKTKAADAADEYSKGLKEKLQSTGDYLKTISTKGIDILKNTLAGAKEKIEEGYEYAENFGKEKAKTTAETFDEKYNKLLQKVKDHSDYITNEIENRREDVKRKVKSMLHDTTDNEEGVGKIARDRIRDIGSSSYQQMKNARNRPFETKDVKRTVEDFFEKGKEVGENVYEKGKEVGENVYEKGKQVGENVYEKGKEVGENVYDKGKEVGENIFDRAVDMGKSGFNTVKDSVKKTIHGLEEARSNAYLREHAVRLLTVLENAEKTLHYSQKIAEDFIEEVSKRLKEC